MTKAVFIVRNGALIPAEPEAAQLLAKIADGTEVVVDVRKPRGAHGLYQLRKYWKFCTIIAENMPVFSADKRGVSDMLMIACHECDYRVNPCTGETTPVPRSLSLETMEEDVFDRLWRRMVYYACTEWLHIGGDELERLLEEFFAGPDERARRASLGKRVSPKMLTDQRARAA